jgi:hypothetical protein
LYIEIECPQKYRLTMANNYVILRQKWGASLLLTKLGEYIEISRDFDVCRGADWGGDFLLSEIKERRYIHGQRI